MITSNEDIKAKVRAILEDKSAQFSYGILIMVLLVISKEPFNVATVKDNLIFSIVKQLTDNKDYQNIIFHGIKNGFHAMNLEKIAPILKEHIVSTLMLGYSRLNLVTYEQTIINLQHELKKIKNNPHSFNLADNFFLRKTDYSRRRTDEFIYLEKMLETTSALNKFDKFWREIYDNAINQHKETKKIKRNFFWTGAAILFIFFIYFTQFRNANSEPKSSNKSTEKSLSDLLNWNYIIIAAITFPIIWKLISIIGSGIARTILAVFPQKGTLRSTNLINRSKDMFSGPFATYFNVDLILLSDLPAAEKSSTVDRIQFNAKAPVAIVLNPSKEQNFNEKKLLEYEPTDPLLLNLEQNIYKRQNLKKTSSRKNKNPNNSDTSELTKIEAKPEVEVIEWRIPELELHIKIIWDPRTGKTYQFGNSKLPCVIKYVSNPRGVKYFCFIPYHTIEEQYSEKTFLTAVSNAAAQPSSNEICDFSDVVARHAKIFREEKIGSAYTMNLTFEVALPGTNRLLGEKFNAVNNNAILEFAPVFFNGGAHTTERKQKSSFGKIKLMDEDLKGVIVKQSMLESKSSSESANTMLFNFGLK